MLERSSVGNFSLWTTATACSRPCVDAEQTRRPEVAAHTVKPPGLLWRDRLTLRQAVDWCRHGLQMLRLDTRREAGGLHPLDQPLPLGVAVAGAVQGKALDRQVGMALERFEDRCPRVLLT